MRTGILNAVASFGLVLVVPASALAQTGYYSGTEGPAGDDSEATGSYQAQLSGEGVFEYPARASIPRAFHGRWAEQGRECGDLVVEFHPTGVRKKGYLPPMEPQGPTVDGAGHIVITGVYVDDLEYTDFRQREEYWFEGSTLMRRLDNRPPTRMIRCG